MKDLINCTIETLIKLGNESYVEESRVAHKAKDQLVEALKKVKTNKDGNQSKIITQALFESGIISYDEYENFTLNSIEKYIYGGKMMQVIETFLSLHEKLKEKGFSSPDNTYNTSGDNYFCALEFNIKPSKQDVDIRNMSNKIAKRTHEQCRPFPTDVFRKVIVIENQLPMYAIVLDYSIITSEPCKMSIVQLKESHGHSANLEEFIKQEFVLENCPCDTVNGNRTSKRKVIAELDISKMESSHLQFPVVIESALFNLYSGLDSINANFD
jgi:hypothetical protein